MITPFAFWSLVAFILGLVGLFEHILQVWRRRSAPGPQIRVPSRSGWALAYKIRGGREGVDQRRYATKEGAEARIKQLGMGETVHAVYVPEREP
jgi:hypothetical protein